MRATMCLAIPSEVPNTPSFSVGSGSVPILSVNGSRAFRESLESLRWWLPLERLDRGLTRAPGLRWLCWNVAVIGRVPRRLGSR